MSKKIMMEQGDVTKILVSLAKIETLQAVSNKEFEDHKADDKEHFDRIYDTLEVYVVKMEQNTSALKVFETKVLAWVTGISVAGIIITQVLNLYAKFPAVVG